MNRTLRTAAVALFGLGLVGAAADARADGLAYPSLIQAQAGLAGVDDAGVRAQADSLLNEARGALGDGEQVRAGVLAARALDIVEAANPDAAGR